MGYFEAFLFGAIQGLTEYLPVSSSAHLILFPRFFGVKDPGLAFDVFLHIGTLFSTLIYFWKDWVALLRMKKGVAPYFVLICATVPALVMGALFHKHIESILRGNIVIVMTLVLGGLLLWWVDRVFKQSKVYEDVGPRGAFFVGCMQCLSLVPGFSRSGATLTGARMLGLSREASAKFSFFMAVPITLAAIVYELRNGLPVDESLSYGCLIVALLSSFCFGALAIHTLMKILKGKSFLMFAIYRCALAVLIALVLGV